MIIQTTLLPNAFVRIVSGFILLFILQPALAGSQSILVMGDSISAAYGMSLEQGWINLMSRRIAETHPQYRLVNASISGETTAGALLRLPPLLEQHQPAIVIIELGGNDGLRGYPVNRLKVNLQSMAQMSKEMGAQVILVPMEIPPNYGSRYTAAFRESYIKVASETDSVLSPFLLENVATEPQLMQSDGIHPSVAAQEKLMSNFLPTLLSVLP